MENLIISVLRVLDDRRQDGFDIIAGKAGDSAEAEVRVGSFGSERDRRRRLR